MILEVEDIIGKDKGFGHVAVPPGLTLGAIFAKDERLRSLDIVQLTLNGQRIDDWKSLSPQKGDRVRISVAPQEAITFATVFTALSIISAVISIVAFFISLFNQPKAPGGKGQGESATYGFEGIRSSLPPGDPVPWVYGIHRKGGQVLQYIVDVTSDRQGQQMSMLLGMAEGEITSMSAIEVNGLPIESVSSATFEIRTGLSSQAIIPGFERIRNTFFDGREISDPVRQAKNQTSHIVYRTNGNDIESVDLQVEAFNGIANLSPKTTAIDFLTVRYSIEQKDQTSADSPANWTVVASPRDFTAATVQPIFDVFGLTFLDRIARDIRLTYLGIIGNDGFPGDNASERFLRWRLRLKNVTEYRDAAPPHSSTALLGIRAVANQQLQGGRPNVTAVVHGKRVRRYDSVNSFTIGHSQNPAWGVLDYLTNSIYGMGPFVPTLTDVDLQSFVDFATLAESLAPTCEPE